MDDKTQMKRTGTNDSPSSNDLFDIKAYTNGVSEFIASCNCPMTIAIQGDWGTGKTSMMHRIKEEDVVKDNCVAVDLNTWEYSQFELGNNLPIVFYSALIEKMGGKKKSPAITENVKNAIKGVLQFGLSFAEKSTSGPLALVAGAAKAGTENWVPVKCDRTLVEATEELKTNFEKVLNSRLEADKKERMVIFIDDLDRIEPKRAVELMEILKILLEVDNCVFVLAIDYDVVVRGIKAKYGADMDERKARSFFDKIIQVPFSLPVGSYNIENYVSELLRGLSGKENKANLANGLLRVREKDSAVQKDEDKEFVARDEVIELIRHSVGCNPRAIKRLINSFSLLCLIRKAQNEKNSQETRTKDDEDVVLFASLCLQLSYSRIYDYLLTIRNSKEDVNGLIDLIAGLDPKEVNNDEIYKGITDVRVKESLRLGAFSEADLYQLSEFFDQLRDVLSYEEESQESADNEKEYCISDEKYEMLKKILRFASSTSVEQDSAAVSEKLPAKIMYVCQVAEEVLVHGKSLSNATKHVAETTIVSGKPITPSAVSDKYTRQLGKIHTKDFEKLLTDYKNGKRDLVERLKDNNQDRYRNLIDMEFSKIDALMKRK